jgi:short-subunit dehydrogenase
VFCDGSCVNLGGRTALLTGASGGLGQVIARAFARRGAQLVLSARRVEVLEPLAAEVGGRVVPCELTHRAALERLVEEAGPVDVLVANAGVPGSGVLESFSLDEIDRALDVNLRAPIILARLLSEGMASRGGGHLVFISSLNGKSAPPGTPIYAATKFGLRGFAQSLRQDLRPRGIGVSTVFPGFIRDAGFFHDAGVKLPPYVRTKAPEDVGRAVLDAIENDRAEIDVAPFSMKIGAALGGLLPDAAAVVQRRLGAAEISSQFEAGQRDKR